MKMRWVGTFFVLVVRFAICLCWSLTYTDRHMCSHSHTSHISYHTLNHNICEFSTNKSANFNTLFAYLNEVPQILIVIDTHSHSHMIEALIKSFVIYWNGKWMKIDISILLHKMFVCLYAVLWNEMKWKVLFLHCFALPTECFVLKI